MLTLIENIFRILNKKYKINFILLFFLLVISSLIEVLAVFTIAPLVSVISNFELINTNEYLNKIYNFFLFENINNFIIFLSILFFLSILTSSIFQLITNYFLIKFSHNVGHFLSSGLYRYYLSKDWLFFSRNQSYVLSKKINTDIGTIVQNVIMAMLFLFSKFFFVIFIFISILFVDIKIALTSVIIFLFFYIVFFLAIKKKLKTYGKIISNVSGLKYKLINEGFGGIKDIIISNSNQKFVNKFQEVNKIVYSKNGNIIFLSQIPRNILEVISIGIIILVVVVLLGRNSGDITQVLPLLSIYALSGLKLIPSIQLIFNNFSLIKSGLFSFYSVYEELFLSQKVTSRDYEKNRILSFNKNICFKNYSFSYNKKTSIIKNLNLEVKKNQTIGIVGPNGSGKSTILDILLGIIITDNHYIYIDDKKLTKSNVISWQKKIGYVSQNFFLFETSIIDNITLEENFELVDQNKLSLAIKYSGLDAFINKLPEGIKTNVSEKGVSLSGGQKQKINIARCLYRNPDILIFDEITNALDIESETLVADMIEKFYGKKTIIFVTHKIELLKNCDLIYHIKDGKVSFKGNLNQIKNFMNNDK